MVAPRTVSEGRPNVVAVRLSDAELEHVDAHRGPLSRSQWLRLTLLNHKKAVQDPSKSL